MSVSPLTAEQLATYRATARDRAAARSHALARRRDTAWELARRAANLLRREYGAIRVVVFGSLSTGALFDERSDIDIAAWDIAYGHYWRACGAVAARDTAFAVDLVRAEEASAGLVEAIERQSTTL